jgi:hypothetical protein
MDGFDQLFDGRPVVGAVAPESVREHTAWVDNEVPAKLQGILCWGSESGESILAEELQVPTAGLQAPDAPDRTPTQPEPAIGDPVGIDENRVVQRLPGDVLPYPFRIAKNDQNHLGIWAKLCEPVAHGDGVGCARQSMRVTVKDQDHVLLALIAQPPELVVDVLENNVGRQFTDKGAL